VRMPCARRFAALLLVVMTGAACGRPDESSANPRSAVPADPDPARVALVPVADQAAAPKPVPNPTELDPGLPSGAKSLVLDLRFPAEGIGSGRVEGVTLQETGTELRIQLAADVLFEFDKADVRPAAEAALAEAAALIRDRAVGEVRIEGHTDGKGTPAYNQRLSERRAESVRRSLAGRGLSHVTWSVRGFGATRPVAPNTKPGGADDPEGRARNRRVEVVITTKQ
jgi:outer membrane protein OmpA-like peptidoglycan-associated protein